MEWVKGDWIGVMSQYEIVIVWDKKSCNSWLASVACGAGRSWSRCHTQYCCRTLEEHWICYQSSIGSKENSHCEGQRFLHDSPQPRPSVTTLTLDSKVFLKAWEANYKPGGWQRESVGWRFNDTFGKTIFIFSTWSRVFVTSKTPSDCFFFFFFF